LTISDIAKAMGVLRPHVSAVISGRRLSPVTEQRIADFLGKPVDYLFPRRCPAEIRAMREAEAAAKATLLPCEGNAA
jgi:transcriptional regulator with XRE-family HTH domain